MNHVILVTSQRAETERIEPEDKSIELGDWYWFKHESKDYEEPEILCCVMHIGSNYARLRFPEAKDKSSDSWRVHLSDFDRRCRIETGPQAYFEQWALEERRAIVLINAEIKDICARLGVEPGQKQIADKQSGGGLSLVSSAVDTGEYKNALIKAKEESLPALFKKIEQHSSELTRWMMATSLTMRAKLGDMSCAIGVIEDRIEVVSIYAGLTEHIDLVREGQPAGAGEKLHIMQGKLFMDEECLLNYMHGGMEFKDICEFDEWLSKPDNFNRILPFSKCMVAFQVRRNRKERDDFDCLETAWINFELDKQDKYTYLYVRNGERLYRVSTEIHFKDEIFADRDEFNFDEPVMVHNYGNHEVLPVREFDERKATERVERKLHEKKVKEWRKQRALFLEWQKQNPELDEHESGFDSSARWGMGPHRFEKFHAEHWSLLNDENVYIDDVNDRVRKQANEYNKISTLIQGLLDRSDALHPHPTVKLWTPTGFDNFIELIYDHDRTLYNGDEPPSWEEYKALCSSCIRVGSIVTGQDAVWYASLPREVDRNDRNYRTRIPYIYTEGNPGPGLISVVPEWSNKTKKATFRWNQTRYIYRRGWGERSGERKFHRSISVHADDLFNISGYTPGDYKQFFNDPRTRRAYYKWAHLLLTAEEYYAGNLDPVTFKKKEKEDGNVE